MDRGAFTELMEARFDWMRKINATKASDYAGDADALANIRRTAEHTGLTNRQVLLVYMTKHLDAIYTYCKSVDGELKSEDIEDRLGDVMFYCSMLEADAAERAAPDEAAPDEAAPTAAVAEPPGRADKRVPNRLECLRSGGRVRDCTEALTCPNCRSGSV